KVIARTRECIPFRNAPTWTLLDSDFKQMPPATGSRLDAVGGFEVALFAVVPRLKSAARVSRASTSAGLSHRDTGERYPGTGGMHLYFMAQNGEDIPRAIKALHARMWLHGWGWFMIDSVGRLHERSLIDTAVRYPERL